ncbi:YcxB family protein [Streptomyces sp. NPDC055808]
MHENRDDRTAAVGPPEVHLSYDLTVKDFKEAIGARAKASASARRQRVVMLVCGPLVLVCLVMALVTGGSVPLPLLVAGVVFAALMVGMPRLQARQFHKLNERNGEYRSTVSDAGITVAHQHAATTLTWRAKTRYVETPHLFVLLGPDKNAATLTILPKRGTPDVDGLRAALDRSMARV